MNKNAPIDPSIRHNIDIVYQHKKKEIQIFIGSRFMKICNRRNRGQLDGVKGNSRQKAVDDV